MHKTALVVISYYDRHPLNNLIRLLRSLMQYPAGGAFDICIIVNQTRHEKVRLPEEFDWVSIEYRHNLGMNIGAWDYGWRARPGYGEYLFLQDECYAIRAQWLAGYRATLDNPKIGMIGESLNRSWDMPWGEIKRRLAESSLPGHFINGEVANRVDCYLHFFREYAVDPGFTGTHLRSLIWFFPSRVLDRIDGFLVGRNYGECIAAEISASKRVQSMGLEIAQAKEEEFFYFRHFEYNQDHPTSPYTHNVNYVSYAAVRELFTTRERDLWDLLRFKLRKRLVLRRLKILE